MSNADDHLETPIADGRRRVVAEILRGSRAADAEADAFEAAGDLRSGSRRRASAVTSRALAAQIAARA